MTKNQVQENIRKIISVKQGAERTKIFQLGPMFEPFIFDTNAETLGLNREKDEKVADYIKRVWYDPIFTETACHSLAEGHPKTYAKMNANCRTSDETYYFSMATGSRCKRNEKARE
jgi:hypothetical protein